jgi:hypothetical protein
LASCDGGTGRRAALRGPEFFKNSHQAASPTSSDPKNSIKSSSGPPAAAVPPLGLPAAGALLEAGGVCGVAGGVCPNATAANAALSAKHALAAVKRDSTQAAGPEFAALSAKS